MDECSEKMGQLVKRYGQSQTDQYVRLDEPRMGRGETVLARAAAERRLLEAIGELETTLGVCQAEADASRRITTYGASIRKNAKLKRQVEEAKEMDELLVEGYTHEQAEAVSEQLSQCLADWKAELWRLEKKVAMCQISIAGYEAEIARLKHIREAYKAAQEEASIYPTAKPGACP